MIPSVFFEEKFVAFTTTHQLRGKAQLFNCSGKGGEFGRSVEKVGFPHSLEEVGIDPFVQ